MVRRSTMGTTDKVARDKAVVATTKVVTETTTKETTDISKTITKAERSQTSNKKNTIIEVLTTSKTRVAIPRRRF